MTTKENPEIPKDDDMWRIYLEHFKTLNNNRHQLVEGLSPAASTILDLDLESVLISLIAENIVTNNF